MPAMKIDQVKVGRGILGLCALPGRSGDYAGDLLALRGFDPGAVLSLVEIKEYQRHGAPTLARDLAALGITHVQFPVRDFGTPNAALWAPVAAWLQGQLAAGQRILIHCLAGCGRTGTAALRVMVDAGEDPSAALLRLRAVRPCAVETSAQERWAMLV
jgi:protein-tyrosine phosphatase